MIRKRKIEIGLMSFILALLVLNNSAFVQGGYTDTNSGPILIDQSYDASMPFITDSNVVIDGSINEEEYGQSYENTQIGMTVSWEYNDDNMTIGLQAAVTGWVAIGFGSGMEDANILMAGVTSTGDVYCYDITGVAGFSHEDDTDLSGSDNILTCAGTESEGTTMVELIFSFTPVDSLDPVPTVGTIQDFFLGYNEDSDEKTRIHDAYATNLDLYYKPPTLNVETNLAMTAPETVHQEQNFSITITALDINATQLSNVSISVGYKTAFGNFMMASGFTNTEGELEVVIHFQNVMGPVTLIAISQELISTTQSATYAYLGTVAEKDITVEAEEVEEEPTYVITSRWALVGGFWLIGIIIWSTFGYNFYAIFQIYRHRNDDITEDHSDTPQMEEST